MATPTDQQQIRATLRRHARNNGDGDAADLAINAAIDIVGLPCVLDAITLNPVVQSTVPAMAPTYADPVLPALMGTAEVADAFGIANSNISKLGQAFRPEPVCYISGGKVPVYLASDVRAKADARRAAKGGE